MTFEPIWGAIIAWYLFLAGLGGGAFVTSAFLGWRHPEAVSMRKIGHLVAPIVVIIGLCLLMFDAKAGLMNPLRFALLLTNFGSVMTWGVVFLGGFTVISLVVVVLDFMKKRVPVWLDIAGVVFGVAVAMYTGALLGVCKTFPLWNNALLPICSSCRPCPPVRRRCCSSASSGTLTSSTAWACSRSSTSACPSSSLC